jgi:hypothetical protein
VADGEVVAIKQISLEGLVGVELDAVMVRLPHPARTERDRDRHTDTER